LGKLKKINMLKNFRPFSFIILSLLFAVSSCKKDSVQVTDPEKDEMAVHSEDQSKVSGDIDGVTNDLNLAIESYGSFSGKYQKVAAICGATTTVDTVSNPKKITITYNGNDCSNTHNRVGTVVLSMPAGVQWKNMGAVLTITYNNLKITRLADNKFIRINGVHTLTNVSGGLIVNLANLNEIVHTLQSDNMSITFMDSTSRNWKVAKKRIYNYNNGIVIRTIGTHSLNNVTGVSEWGTDRFGHPFVTAITEPLRIRQDCSFRLVSGQVKHVRLAMESVVTFGLDAAGNATTCPGAAPFYFKAVWTGPNGNTITVIHPY
jgi:hypothetical protein